MPTLESLRLIRIKATTEGVNEATAAARGLEKELGEVATVSERTTRSTVGLDRSLDTLRKSIDGTYRSSVAYERGLATLNRALDSGRISGAAHARDLDLLAAKYRSSEQSAGRFAQGVSRAHSLASGAIAGFVATATSAISLTAVQDATKAVADMNDAASRIGIGTSELQKLRYAAELAGGSVESMDTGLEKFARNISEAARGNGELAKVLTANGVSLKDQAGNLRSVSDMVAVYSDLIKNAKSPQDQLNLAAIAFGKQAGPDLVISLRDGSDALREMMQEAQRSGSVIDEQLVKKAADLDDAFAKANLQLGSAFKEFSITAAPAVVSGLQEIKRFLDEVNAAGQAWKRGDYFGAIQPLLGDDIAALKKIAEQLRGLVNPRTYGATPQSQTEFEADAQRRRDVLRRMNPTSPFLPSPQGRSLDERDERNRLPVPQPYGGPDEAARGRALGGLPVPVQRGPTVLPPGSGGDDDVQRTQDRAARARERELADFQRSIEGIQQQTMAVRLQTQTLGMSEGAAAAYRTEQELIVEALRNCIPLTDEMSKRIHDTAQQYGQATDELKRYREEQQKAISDADSLRETTRGVFSDIANGIAQGKSGKEIFRGILGNISGKLIDAGSAGLTEQLLGKDGKAGGGLFGDFVSGLLGGGQRGASPNKPVFVSFGAGGAGALGNLIPGAANSNVPNFGGIPGSNQNYVPGAVTSAPLGAAAPPITPVQQQSIAASMVGPLMSGGKLNPGAAFAYLRSKGLSDAQAAVALGNFKQESGLDPIALNRGEGAFGLYQTRLDRRTGLNSFAADQGLLPSDPRAQMDFMLREMRTTESGAGSRFFAADDLASANAAMKGFIRYGDQSQGARLGYAQSYMNQFGGGQQQAIAAPALDKVTASLQKVNQAAVPVAPALADASKGFEGVGSSLGSIGSMLGGAIGGQKGGSVGGAIGGILSQIFSLFQFADGGIMTPRGPLPLMAYAGGGIVDRPQLRLAGEGSMNEAIVPLPNGRSIPVQMRGGLSRPANSNRAGGGFSFRGGDNNFTFNGGKPDEEMLNAMKREVAASEARTKADMVRNWAAYQQAHANGFG